jgi:stress-induced-phosphoprotein 1
MGDEDAAKHLFALGSQAAKDSNYGVAYAQFSEALENASSVELKSAVLISRSRTLGALSRWGEALADAEECRKIRPSWSRAFEYKAAALAGLGRAAEAEICNRLAAALASLKQDPKSEVSDSGFPPCL